MRKIDKPNVIRRPWNWVMGELVCPIRVDKRWILLTIEQVSQMGHIRRKETGITDLIEWVGYSYTETNGMWCICESDGTNTGLYNPDNGSYLDVEDAVRAEIGGLMQQ